MSTGTPRLPDWLATLLILVLTFAVHAPSIDNDFVFDDRQNVQAVDPDSGRPQEMIATLHPLPVYFTSHYLRGAAETSRGYRPVTVYSYALTFHVFCGGDPADDSALPHHLINVLLQVCNTWLVLLILLRLCARLPAFCGTAVFGVHAIHSEVVAGIVGRGELLGFCFGAGALLLYLRGNERSRGARLGHFVAAAAALFLAFCSKESALAWLAFLPMVRIAQHFLADHGDTRDLKRDIRDALLLAALPAIAFLALYYFTLRDLPPYNTSYLTNPLCYTEPLTRLLTAITVWVYALFKTLAPFSLCCDYGANVFTLVDSLAAPRLWGAALLLVVLLVGGLRLARRHPLLFLAMTCFFGFSFIVSNLPLAQETIYAERTYYAPSLALSLVVAWLVDQSRARPWPARWRTSLLAGVGLWIAACCVVDVERMNDWADNDTLFAHDAGVQPRSLRLLDNVAEIHKTRGQRGEQRRFLQQQLEVEPEYTKALLLLGQQEILQRRFAAAGAYFERCRNSRLLPLINRTEHESRLYYNVGLLLVATERQAEALPMFERAAAIDPGFAKAQQFLVRGLVRATKLGRATRVVAAAKLRWPDDPVFDLLQGKILLRQKEYKAAERALDAAFSRLPWGKFLFDDCMDLTEAVLRQGRKPEAMRILDKFLQMGGGVVPPEDRGRLEQLRRG